jgi:hypothetical protein
MTRHNTDHVTFSNMSCEFSQFVILRCEMYLMCKTKRHPKEMTVNWIFESYSNVYNTAMMVEQRPAQTVSKAKTPVVSKFARLFKRG